jgi:hypothetical protein
MKKWPKQPDEPLPFPTIADPIVSAIRFAYDIKRKNVGKDIPWKGPNIGRRELSTCFPPDIQLSAETLGYALDDQGRDALEEIIGVAIRLGIEQGRRILRAEPEYQMLETKAKYK